MACWCGKVCRLKVWKTIPTAGTQSVPSGLAQRMDRIVTSPDFTGTDRSDPSHYMKERGLARSRRTAQIVCLPSANLQCVQLERGDYSAIRSWIDLSDVMDADYG